MAWWVLFLVIVGALALLAIAGILVLVKIIQSVDKDWKIKEKVKELWKKLWVSAV